MRLKANAWCFSRESTLQRARGHGDGWPLAKTGAVDSMSSPLDSRTTAAFEPSYEAYLGSQAEP